MEDDSEAACITHERQRLQAREVTEKLSGDAGEKVRMLLRDGMSEAGGKRRGIVEVGWGGTR